MSQSTELSDWLWSHCQESVFAAELSTRLLVGANPATEVITGYSHGEIIGRPAYLLCHPTDRLRLLHLLTSRPDSTGKFRFQCKDGTVSPLTFFVADRLTIEGSTLVLFSSSERTAYNGSTRNSDSLHRLLSACRNENGNRRQAQRRLSGARSATISSLLVAMETRDPHTANHETRVAEIAWAIGREMGWDEDRLEGLRLAAMVHDLGKIAVPLAILSKQERLTSEEWAVVQSHVEIGYAILKDVPLPWPIADIVRQHHEKLDGSGYPFGLHSEQILPEARVLTVADMIEAMTTDRPYRRAMPIKRVLAELNCHAGSQLDGKVVEIVQKLFHRGKLSSHPRSIPGLSSVLSR